MQVNANRFDSEPDLASLQMIIEMGKMGYLESRDVAAACHHFYEWYMAPRTKPKDVDPE